jgi:hypothetical protein
LKVLIPGDMTNISANLEDADFPVENVLDSHVKRKYKSSTFQGQITFEIAGGIDTVAIFGTNAQTASLTISDPNEVEWETGVEWEPGVEWELVEVSVPDIALIQQASSYAMWFESTAVSAPVQVTLSLVSHPDTILEVGVVRAGISTEFRNPSFGLNESLVDYSIKKTLSNGATYYKKRDIVRQFSGDVVVDRDNDFYLLTQDIIRTHGSIPFAWKLTEINDNWVVFGRPSMPSGSHVSPTYSTVQFSITEEI